MDEPAWRLRVSKSATAGVRLGQPALEGAPGTMRGVGMKRIRITGCVIVGIFVACAAGAGTAAAALPEVGRCEPVEGVVEGTKTVHHGGYVTSGCTKVSASKTGKYEWTSGPGVHADFSGTGRSTVIADAYQGVYPYKATITCHTSAVAGEYTGATTVSATFTLTGCEWKEATENCGYEQQGCSGGNHGVCQTEGSAAGEIKTSPLSGELGFITAGAKPRVGISFAPSEEGPFAAYKCGTASMSLLGSVIGSVLPEKMYATSKLTFAGTAGQ